MNDKFSYPNEVDFIPRSYPYDTNKWLNALKEIKIKCNSGMSYIKAYELITNTWNSKEIKDFHNWVRFYEEQGHMKYKTAQLYGYEGYYLPTNSKSSIPSPVVVIQKDEDKNLVNDNLQNSAHLAAEKKKMLIEHRKKILSRLQSARKLFTLDQGKALAGENLNAFLDVLNDLEKQIHSLKVASNVISSLVLRKANILEKQGSIKSSEIIRSFAQGLPGATPPADPNASIPEGGALGNNNPNISNAPNDALLQFLNGLNGEDPFEDENDVEDDEVDIEDDLEDSLEIEDDGLLSTAQEIPNNIKPIQNTIPVKPVSKESPKELTVSDSDLEVLDEPLNETNVPEDFDSLIDAAFSNLKVSDIVKKLDDLSRIFKNREIARQLSIVDMMMDKLGLTSFFPSLAEATRSALESNQYCLVRIDEVKSRLAGALNQAGNSVHDMGADAITDRQDKVDLMGEDSSPDEPLLNQVKTNLDSQQKKDKLKKELRKNIEDKALLEAGNKQKAEVTDLANELEKEEKKNPVITPAPAPAPLSPINKV